MKTAISFMMSILLFLLVTVPLAAADKATGPKYDPANEVLVKGSVEEIKTMGTDELKDTHLILKTDKGLVEICLCPAKVLSDMDMSFAKGDKLEVTGAKAKESDEGTEVILARQIVRGDSTLVLRDKNGGPVWTWRLKH